MHRLLRRSWVQVVVGALMLMAVIAISGRPTVFTDTDDYYAQGRGAARALRPLIHIFAHTQKDADQDAAYLEAEADEDHTSMAARSPYYGILLYGTYRIGTLWLLAAVQSLVASWTVFCLVKSAIRHPKPHVYLAIMAGLSLFSTLPFFAGFAMPDLFAAVGAIATIALAIYWERFTLWERVALTLVVASSLWFHTSHILLEAGLVVLIDAGLWWFGTSNRNIALRTGLFCLLIASAFASDVAYHTVVKLRTGEDLHRPPFLVARVLADGPGRIYLREVCIKAAPYVLCRFRANPLDNSDEILWADDPARGIFNASRVKIRIELEREEKAFVAATVLHHPIAQIGASLSNWGEQIMLVDLSEPLRDPTFYFTNVYWKDTSLPSLIPDGQTCLKTPKVCKPRLDIEPLSWIHSVAIWLSLAFLLWRGLQRDVRTAIMSRSSIAPGNLQGLCFTAAILVLAVVVNSAFTGILSGPFSRYNARIVWLVPMAAMIVGFSIGPGFDVTAKMHLLLERWRKMRSRYLAG